MNDSRMFNVPLADRPMPDFVTSSLRRKYGFEQIGVGQYTRFPYAPRSVEAAKIRAAAASWARKNVGKPVFAIEEEVDAICVWRVAQ